MKLARDTAGSNSPLLDWHGVKCRQPDWGSDSHTLALHAEVPEQGLPFYHMEEPSVVVLIGGARGGL